MIKTRGDLKDLGQYWWYDNLIEFLILLLFSVCACVLYNVE